MKMNIVLLLIAMIMCIFIVVLGLAVTLFVNPLLGILLNIIGIIYFFKYGIYINQIK